MRLVVFSTTNFPIIGLHGFCTIGVVLLEAEVRLVGGELRQVRLARLDHLRYRGEAVTDLDLTLTQRAVAFHRGTQVNAVTVFGGRCSGSVGREQHLLAAVLTTLTRFGQCAGYMINSGGINYFCHFVAWAETSHDCVIKNHL